MSALSYQDVQVHFNNADSTLYKRAFSDICKYCEAPLIVWRNSVLWEQFEIDKKWAFKICTQCGYWMYYCNDIWDGSILITEAVLQKFNLGDDKVPLEAVEVELSKNWKLSKHISAGRAEDLVAKIFAEHMECEIEYLTDSVYSADRGIDFVLVTKVNGTRSAFQVKRRIRSGSESVVPVRAFVGAT